MSMLSRRLLMWGGAAAIGTAGFAFMASNTVGASYAGAGSQKVSGYTVSDISYTGISATGGGRAGTLGWAGSATLYNPAVSGLTGDALVTTVSFRVNPDNALWSEVQLYNSAGTVIGGGGATNCHEASGVWTCAVTGVPNTANGGNASGVLLSRIASIDVEAAH